MANLPKCLVIAEKPSVARELQKVYNTIQSSVGYLADFAAFHGHLMRLKTPEEIESSWGTPWTADQLPMIPSSWSYTPADAASATALRDKIKAGNYDFVVNACDAGREGEHIFWSFYESYGFTLPVKRYWASSNTKPAITAALKNLLPASKFDGLKLASKLRPQFDWLVGMNFSRAVSVSSKKATSIGRVMTVVQKLVVDRELEIQNFKAETFAEIEVKFKAAGGAFTAMSRVAPDFKGSRYPSKADAESVAKTFKKTWQVYNTSDTDRSVMAPTCFSLTELQKSANAEYKMSPDSTLAAAQSLYEKGFLTYPRTESRYLPTDMIPELLRHIQSVYSVPVIGDIAKKVTQADIDRATKDKTYVDDGRIEDHHAIIPTEDPVNFSSLSSDEQKIYSLVARQFVAIFLPPYRDKRTVVLLTDGVNLCRTEGCVVVDPGYTVLSKEKKDDVILPALTKGDSVVLDSHQIKEGKTKPPARYTPRTILSAMQNAGQYVSDSQQRYILKEASGIGTPATRAEILKKLVDKKLLILEKNQYSPSAYSMAFIAQFGEKDFCSPKLTAVWESKLRQIEEGKFTGNFKDEMEAYIRSEVSALLNANVNFASFRREIVGVCPLCGKPVAAFDNFYACTGSTKEERDAGVGCKFSMGKVIHGTTITEKDMSVMLSGKKTAFKNFTNSEGKKYTCKLYFEEGTLCREFKQSAGKSSDGEKVDLGKCPVCGKTGVYESAKFFNCSDKDCKFAQRKIICQAEITANDMKNMCAGQKSAYKKFVWKSGKPGKGRLYYDASGDLQFDFN